MNRVVPAGLSRVLSGLPPRPAYGERRERSGRKATRQFNPTLSSSHEDSWKNHEVARGFQQGAVYGEIHEMKLLTPIKAIRTKCLDCMCQQPKEVRLCPDQACTLWPYRMGRRPKPEEVRSEKGE
jgi:hypothetical protein